MNKFNIFSNLSVLMNAGFHVERILKLLTLFLSLIVSNITNNVRIRIVRFFNLPLFLSFCNISISITTVLFTHLLKSKITFIVTYAHSYVDSPAIRLQIRRQDSGGAVCIGQLLDTLSQFYQFFPLHMYSFHHIFNT